MGPQLHETLMGRKLIEIVFPDMVKSIKDLSQAFKESTTVSNELIEMQKKAMAHPDKTEYWCGMYENVMHALNDSNFDDLTEEDYAAITERVLDNDYLSQTTNEVIVDMALEYTKIKFEQENKEATELERQIVAYNDYIMNATEEGKFETGWTPVCFTEFVDSEWVDSDDDEDDEEVQRKAYFQYIEDNMSNCGKDWVPFSFEAFLDVVWNQ